jgi:hypothetical protein
MYRNKNRLLYLQQAIFVAIGDAVLSPCLFGWDALPKADTGKRRKCDVL